MEVSQVSATALANDMDIDMDIDMQLGEDEAALQADAMTVVNIHSSPDPSTNQTIQHTAAGPPAESPSLRLLSFKESQPYSTHVAASSTSEDPNHITAHKVHIRGVDNLHTSDIKQFASEHFESSRPLSIDWIDDTSANLVYENPEIAEAALDSFSSLEYIQHSALSSLQSRLAKTLSTHPDSKLEVRMAVASDKKQPKARERSRYYLFHPEHDPGERRRRTGRDRRREDGDNSDYQRRRYDDREERRRRDQEENSGFDASMYDEEDTSKTANHDDRRHAFSSRSSEDERGRGAGRELFPERVSKDGRRRIGRSASPMRDRDDDLMSDAVSRQRSGRLRDRSYSPPTTLRPESPLRPITNSAKELFPSKPKDISSELRGISPDPPKKELFPNRMVLSNHRRSDAFDAADETADLFASKMNVPFIDGSRDRKSKPRSLADRVTREPQATLSEFSEHDEGFSIRGASQQQDSGFSIRGAAGSEAQELFPSKLTSNAGKELFAERLEGRGGSRRKAADMFY
ncbi:MAG: hypothetical protein M4579_000822 [Chaenotheca gracillima]|nr:MAG: hypothetical protein M4579_000822 [Chaenotheca gracillima]